MFDHGLSVEWRVIMKLHVRPQLDSEPGGVGRRVELLGQIRDQLALGIDIEQRIVDRKSALLVVD